MATTKFTVRCGATGGEIVYYGYNCPREGEYIAHEDLHYRVTCVTHYPTDSRQQGDWEEILIEVAEGRTFRDCTNYP